VTGAIQVYLVEDHPVVRQGLRALLLQEGIQVCGEADTLEDCLGGLRELRPDLVIVDLGLGDEDGVDLLRRAARDHPDLAMMVYSAFEDPGRVNRALAAGAVGYLSKRDPLGLLSEAVRACVAGQRFLGPRIASQLAASGLDPDPLSGQEREAFHLVGLGLRGPEIAARMGVNVRTVETYFARIIAKLDLSGMVELRAMARGMRL
jgi:DNA-binding NarL/FixJ family response regulator